MLSITVGIAIDEAVLVNIGTVLAALTFGFTIFFLSFSPAEKAEKHLKTAKELWLIREKHIYLIADISNNRIPEKDIATKRDSLLEELSLVYKFAPNTNAKAYEAAREAVKLNEELSFSNQEIDQLLPQELRLSDG